MKPCIYTIGHSTRTIEAFIELLRAYAVETVVDIRTIPRSRHNPQFNEETLPASIGKAYVSYRHIGALGGLRHAKKNSVNAGWKNASFRGFADYMATEEFKVGLEQLMFTARAKRTAIMCAEAVPWRCHRSLIADALAAEGWRVRHIQSKTSAPLHKKTPFLRTHKGVLWYPEQSQQTLL